MQSESLLPLYSFRGGLNTKDVPLSIENFENQLKKPSISFDGRIEVICGPMFSGKTSELIVRVKRHVIAGRKCIVIKFAEDLRYSSDSISTHEKVTYTAISATVLESVREDVLLCDVIGIDEGQFFPDIETFCIEQRNLGKLVIVSALDMDFTKKSFPSIGPLLARSDKVTKCKAVCVLCKKDAGFSKRLTLDTNLKVIGGSESYAAVCLHCHEFGNFSVD